MNQSGLALRTAIVRKGFTIIEIFNELLYVKKTEAVKIQSSRATHKMNSKAEHRQPAMLRVRMTRENDDIEPGGRRRGRLPGH